jgi:hypothetical protein
MATPVAAAATAVADSLLRTPDAITKVICSSFKRGSNESL